MVDLSTFYMGLMLPSPIVAASSGLTGNIEQLKELEANGAGAVVLKSLFEEEIVVDLERHMNKLHSENYLYPETMDFYENTNVEDTLTNYLKLIFEAKKELSVPVIASVNCITPYNWPRFTQYFQEAGADAVELNVFSLPADLNQEGAFYEDTALKIVEAVAKEVTIPVSVKIGPYYSGLANMINKLSQAGARGVALFNRFYSPDYDLDSLEIIPAPVYSYPNEYINPLRWIALISGKISCDLMATTGIHDGASAAKMILAGANGVQVASSLYKNGIPYLKEINQQLSDWMAEKGFESPDQFRGKLNQSNVENAAGLHRVQFMRHFAGK
ncbi:dihydroorotate dehydrogenase-like protein [Alkalitalea saponilacus]|uniref:Dihydroorotate dehydrogenase (Fumarate) n=1 Tax=Alkalitalea saponilacus TaxID=889453 RepID=A0A1T5HHH9_9BACT|nr:dihydroorotate dehydrogenase-like protein [Alkalitalea saponilacus]ASB48146.1 diguanylate cyclase [Alkalitalea saponilacus]SKC20158.1 dihydroorotate dehydrogenase (fumarate) [Alkalitalea saponilacus]